MAEPTEAELKAFMTVQSICDGVGLSNDNRDILTQGFGCTDGDSFRPIGGMSEADLDAVLNTLQVQSAAPQPCTLAGWKLVGHVARLASGAVLTRSQQQTAQDAAKQASQALAQQLGAQPPVAAQKVGIPKL